MIITVVMENPNGRARNAQPENERRMILLVADNQTFRRQKRRDVQRIRGEAHSARRRVLDAEEPRRQLLQFDMQRARSDFAPGGAKRQAVILNGLNSGVGAYALVLGET